MDLSLEELKALTSKKDEHKLSLLQLKATIKKLVAEQINNNQSRKTALPEEKCGLLGIDYKCYDQSQKIRGHLITYGLVRGIPLKKIESNITEVDDWEYSFKMRCRLVYALIQKYGSSANKNKWTFELVKSELMSTSTNKVG